MKKIIYIAIFAAAFSCFVPYGRAAFNPGSQTIVDYGDAVNAQPGLALPASTNRDPIIASDTPQAYDWFTSALQAELESMDINQPFIVDGIIVNN